MKRFAWLRHQLDRIINWFDGHCPDDWNECGPGCRTCMRLHRRWARMHQYLNERALPEARVE